MFPMLMEAKRFLNGPLTRIHKSVLGGDLALIVNTASYNIVVWGKSSDTISDWVRRDE